MREAPDQAHFGGDNADVFYIPGRLATDYVIAALALAQDNMLSELAVAAIIGLITESADDVEARTLCACCQSCCDPWGSPASCRSSLMIAASIRLAMHRHLLYFIAVILPSICA